MVLVEITTWPTAARGPVGKVIEVLGDVNEKGVDTEIIIRKFGIPDAHGEAAIEEAKSFGAVSARDIAGRTDFRKTTTVTIDGEHARDFDDAISIEKLPNGHYWLGVHIADVAHYVTEGSALDQEGLRPRHLGVFSRSRRAHVSVGTGHRHLLAEPARRSAGAIVPDGSGPQRIRGPARVPRRRHQHRRAHDVHGRERHSHRSRPRR